MAWFLSATEMKSLFGSLGVCNKNNDVLNEDCLDTLETIMHNLKSEDPTMRNFRRAVWYGQHVENDMLPLLNHKKDSTILNTTIKILVDLTSPIGCLLSIDVVGRDQHCSQVLCELEKLLITCKQAFATPEYTKALIDFMQRILEEDTKLSPQQCQSVNNGLLLLRNILHVPESNLNIIENKVSLQNQILFNLFAQKIDKLLLHLMSCAQRSHWSVSMVQLIALIYKDQNVVALQKLLNAWYETSVSESSDGNESNTSPKLQSSGHTSPTIDSSDDDFSSTAKESITQNEVDSDQMVNEAMETQQTRNIRPKPYQTMKINPPSHQKNKIRNSDSNGTFSDEKINNVLKGITEFKDPRKFNPKTSVTRSGKKQMVINSANKATFTSATFTTTSPSRCSEKSDCGYGTQLETQGSISTSSNEDDYPGFKPIHKKPASNKKRFNPASNIRSTIPASYVMDSKRKKLIKKNKSNVRMKCTENGASSEFDVSSLLKDFTVDFLLQGYDKLVRVLHTQLSESFTIDMDKSHFFWLVTYFLKFAAQLELDLDNVSSVFSFDIISYLTYEGVTTCEELELLKLQPGSDLKPCLRRSHLIVTAIKEFLQALETYKSGNHLSSKDKTQLKKLQIQITKTEDLRQLFVLLIRCFNSTIHNRKYLQDLIVTNHLFLLLCDNTAQLTNEKSIMMDHISQFATVEIMQFYGLLLEDYKENGAFVNECIFTMMHHVSGDLNSIGVLFQPKIIKTFVHIWESDFKIGENWVDLVEFVVHELACKHPKRQVSLSTSGEEENTDASQNAWSQKDTDDIFGFHLQTNQSGDWIGNIVQLFQVNAKNVTRINVIEHLFQEKVISQLQFDEMMKFEEPYNPRNEFKYGLTDKPTELCDDIQVLQDRLVKEHKSSFLQWIQNILLECIYVKLNSANKINNSTLKYIKMTPVIFHCILKRLSIPIIPWTAEHGNMLRYQPFILLLRKLGFILPTVSNILYVRIPEYWSVGVLYNVACQLGPIDNSKLKFELAELKRAEFHGKKSNKSKLYKNVYNSGMLNSSSSSQLMTGFTPEPSTNWLSVKMKNKNERLCIAVSAHTDYSLQMMEQYIGLTANIYQSCDSPVHALQHFIINEIQRQIEHPCSCDTSSVASDLSRIYVSDVEDKND